MIQRLNVALAPRMLFSGIFDKFSKIPLMEVAEGGQTAAAEGGWQEWWMVVRAGGRVG